MPIARRPWLLFDEYRFPGFRPLPTVQGIFGDPGARVISFVRREKKQPADDAVRSSGAGPIAKSGAFGTSPAAMSGFISIWRFDESSAGVVVP
jgi:hypothetical protein